jgi:hypothetical protein
MSERKRSGVCLERTTVKQLWTSWVRDLTETEFRRGSMCAKCKKIDVKIARYRTVISQLHADDAVVDMIRGFISDLEAEKIKLHPERQTA